MDWATVGKAAAIFAVTNIDDLVVLAVFFGPASRTRSGVARVIVGQYLGFAAILAVSVIGAFGANLLPASAIPYLGLVPLLLGLRAARRLWRERAQDDPAAVGSARGAGGMQVAAVTFANGGDNISLYVPVFALADVLGTATYMGVFLLGVGLWCVAGWFFATRQAVAALLARWSHIILPVVLIGIGSTILIEAGAFGL
ncbi:cadmium resistance transporter [Mycobacterium montefiorense]|uniref:Cadmium transporter n=1 Tax=Mycobacterium montefiorense TaxID=154654 RepID=A0AA37PTC8_9MYCO|nr:cadmium resistance transporter [Mycobacterium montefiorense]GBG36337.1 cadmium transporter [Mycobacterium montefiorense]GKU32894.1 cadmium transporter [Mycobacterium montefiorense]GKU38636.1 cadmium transporter [Mycobacterium montefiorense]GKU46597.1 cadmium transporter [Mycobacterium montefiorense]GKU51630.1 cadmium transporter [Mycobacterium montefiorense]